MQIIKDSPNGKNKIPSHDPQTGETNPYYREKLEKDPVFFIEETYPQMAEEFKNICAEQYKLFCQKQSNYGPTNISVGTDLKTKDDVRLSLTGLWFRMNDKIQRLKNLIILGKLNAVDESAADSFQDLSNYGIIAQLVSRGKWGK